MRVAAIYDIHGNLPALKAVLADVATCGVDRIMIGGDLIPGPWLNEVFDELRSLSTPIDFISGNGDLAVLAHVDEADSDRIRYWGTVSGNPLPASVQPIVRWNADTLRTEHAESIRRWPMTVRHEISGIGRVLFCHATPRSETACFTERTAESLLKPVFDAVSAELVVCGHTHMPFDRMIGSVRVVNAGSVGMPYGRTGADWLLLNNGVELRHVDYDLDEAASLVRRTGYPQAREFADSNILHSPTKESMLAAMTNLSFA